MRRLLVWSSIGIGLVASTSCRPKGSDKTPTIERTSVGNYVIRHPNFEGHLDPKSNRDGTKWPLKLEYSGLPDKSALVLEGKPIAIIRGSGEIPTSVDLGGMIGDAPIGVLTSNQRIPVNVPFELSFWSGRQKVSATMTDVNVWLELSQCIRNPPCPFSSDGPPNAKPNIVHIKRAETMGQTIIGSPGRLKDIDWIAVSSSEPEVDGRKCAMQKIEHNPVKLTDEHTLKRETERITIFDRRSGAKLHTRDLVGPDRCPIVTEIKLTGPKSGLRSEVEPSARDLLFKELRGEAPPGSSSSSSGAGSGAPASRAKSNKHGK